MATRACPEKSPQRRISRQAHSRGEPGTGRNPHAKWLSPAKLGGILQDSLSDRRSGETGRRAGLKIARKPDQG